MERTCEHNCAPDKCPPGTYYVSCTGENSYWLMSGPYNTHLEALAAVDKAHDIAVEVDPRAFWKSWGTCKIKDGSRKPGVMNSRGLLPLTEAYFDEKVA